VLRVADGFDRGHVGGVERIDVGWAKGVLRLTPVAAPLAPSLRLELWGASRKCGLLARVVERPVEIVGPDGAVVELAEDGERGE
jgi:hypothetical protein